MSNLTPCWKAVIHCPFWFKVSSRFRLWAQPEPLVFSGSFFFLFFFNHDHDPSPPKHLKGPCGVMFTFNVAHHIMRILELKQTCREHFLSHKTLKKQIFNIFYIYHACLLTSSLCRPCLSCHIAAFLCVFRVLLPVSIWRKDYTLTGLLLQNAVTHSSYHWF